MQMSRRRTWLHPSRRRLRPRLHYPPLHSYPVLRHQTSFDNDDSEGSYFFIALTLEESTPEEVVNGHTFEARDM